MSIDNNEIAQKYATLSPQMIETPAASNPPEERAKNSTSGASSPSAVEKHKIHLLSSYFFARTDVVAGLHYKPRPIKGASELPALLAVHVSGPNAPKTRMNFDIDRTRPELKIRMTMAHEYTDSEGTIIKPFRLGSYTLSKETDRVRWICIDFDAHGDKGLVDPTSAMLYSWKAAAAHQLPAYVERSGGGAGWHLWIFIAESLVANEARKIGLHISPKDALLRDGKTADVTKNLGIEVFPKQVELKGGKRLGNMVWLPFWHAAPAGANEFYQIETDEKTNEKTVGQTYLPQKFELSTMEDLRRALRAAEREAAKAERAKAEQLKNEQTKNEQNARSTLPPPDRQPASAPAPARIKQPSVKQSSAGASSPPAPSSWADWRKSVVDRLDFASLYSDVAPFNDEWFHCADPSSSTGFNSKGEYSAGVATGKGEAARGTWHSFRTGETLSPWDYLLTYGGASNIAEANQRLSSITGIATPSARRCVEPATQEEVDALKSVIVLNGDSNVNMDDAEYSENQSEFSAEDGAGAESVGKKGPQPKSARSRLPYITTNDRQFADLLQDAWNIVINGNAPPFLFSRGREIVRINEEVIGQKTVKSIDRMNENIFYGMLSKAATWVKQSKEGIFHSNPPIQLSRVMAADPDSRLPKLEAIAEAPLFSANGNLLTVPGYYKDEALYLSLPKDFQLGEIPKAPSVDDISWARKLLTEDLFGDFPLVDESDMAHAVAATILPIVKRLIGGNTPIHLVEAPTEGSGKGYICHAISIIATGRPSSARTIPQDEESVRKMLTSELSTGRPLILLDNADDKKTLSSSALASIITSDTWTDRLLGATQMVTYLNNAVWMLTGNNPKLSMELARRCVRIRIEPRHERPYLRKDFKHDPFLEWVIEHPSELIRAILILARAWQAKGSPMSSHRLGSFERWAKVIGGILDAVGIPGFLANTEALYEAADVDGQAWRDFVSVWWESFKDEPQKVADLNKLCESQNLLTSTRGDKSEKSQQTRLANALASKRDRVYCGLQIIQCPKDLKTKTLSYMLKSDGTDNPTGSTFDDERYLKKEAPPIGTADISSTNSGGYNGGRYLRF